MRKSITKIIIQPIQIGANHTVVTAQTLFLNAYMQSELRNGYTKTYSDSDGSAFYIAGGSTVTFTVKLQSSSHVVMGYKDSNGKQYQTYNDTNKTNTTSISIPNTGFYRFYLTNVSDSTIKITGGSITF